MKYIIGDVHGCWDKLQKLLNVINFNENNDKLIFLGDLVNRGNNSLKVLDFLINTKNVDSIMGNHDFYLLRALLGFNNKIESFNEIIEHKDSDKIFKWLCKRKLILIDDDNKNIFVHAGVYPYWSLDELRSKALKLEKVFQNPNKLKNVFKNLNDFSNNITFEINCFTRMRLLNNKKIDEQFNGYESFDQKKSWFYLIQQNKYFKEWHIFFGHWSGLKKKNNFNTTCLDSGAIWGNSLTAYCLDNKKTYIS